MINATLRVRCISQSALEAILELLKEESNAIYVEQFPTQETPNTGARASVIDAADFHPSGRLGSSQSKRSGQRTVARSRR